MKVILAYFWLTTLLLSTGLYAGSTNALAFALLSGAGSVQQIVLTQPGSGYVRSPAVLISGGGGTGAEVQAIVDGDKIVEIRVIQPGTGYKQTPDVIIAPPEGQKLLIELVPKLTILAGTGSAVLVEYSDSVDGPWTLLTNITTTLNPSVTIDAQVGAAPRFYRSRSAPIPEGPIGFVWIPPGTFQMGSPDSEPLRLFNETRHEVTLTKGFWISAREVTQAEFESVTGSNPSEIKGATLPVERITWFEAKSYCEAITLRDRQLGKIPSHLSYQLPTEAEWEYAARAGTSGAIYADLEGIAWYSSNSGNQIQPVGAKTPNAWGLHDMIGNVSEWCSDYYGLYTSPKETDPTGPFSGQGRIFRGGSAFDQPERLRAAARNSFFPETRFPIGVRPVLK